MKTGDITSEKFFAEIKSNPTVQTLLSNEVISTALEDKYSDKVTSDDVEKEYKKMKEQYGDQFQSALISAGLTENTYKAQLRSTLLLDYAVKTAAEQELKDLLFCWKVAKFVKSNAIVYAKDNQTIGIGAGQMSRVYSAKIAGIKAQDEGLEVAGCVMASDAFFPFRDGIDAAAKVGIQCVIHPGGSMRDQEVIDAADEHNMVMVLTGMRHFKTLIYVVTSLNERLIPPLFVSRGRGRLNRF